VVLDPFCGCGTAVHAAEKLGRHWIGIDITHLACKGRIDYVPA
jgi:site-specific DNA-methyltransferase (adenine-specific)